MELINHSLELFHDNGCGGRIFKVTVVPGTIVMGRAFLSSPFCFLALFGFGAANSAG